ncbi:hypothetical protein RvY_17656 [Ramazzottius varieornatus]|uniref:Uncharacterized protein n=1 Tax=Ramazzottius varieornatus TaxID=947166 RepID=A0A1D1W8N2_RAMVA|nr:hypothetical protein RvY_17656 [Ramazzottius varieornatus]
MVLVSTPADARDADVPATEKNTVQNEDRTGRKGQILFNGAQQEKERAEWAKVA